MATIGALGPTRLQILDLLRHGPRTVHDLAVAIGVTDNAIRAHVTALERDRLIEQQGRRPGVRKPSVVYDLAPAADQLFPKPYARVLGLVLDEVEWRQGSDELTSIAERVGQELARPHAGGLGSLRGRARVEAIAGLLGELGGLIDVETQENGFRLVGYSCPPFVTEIRIPVKA